jgi:hypothetical protein
MSTRDGSQKRWYKKLYRKASSRVRTTTMTSSKRDRTLRIAVVAYNASEKKLAVARYLAKRELRLLKHMPSAHDTSKRFDSANDSSTLLVKVTPHVVWPCASLPICSVPKDLTSSSTNDTHTRPLFHSHHWTSPIPLMPTLPVIMPISCPDGGLPISVRTPEALSYRPLPPSAVPAFPFASPIVRFSETLVPLGRVC